MDELRKFVEVLIKKSAETSVAVEALQYSQAACNAANAVEKLQSVQRESASR